MAIIYIENKKYFANESENLLSTCLTLGFDVPYFCWHPELGSIGACRQCMIKQYNSINDNKDGTLILSCMTPVINGASISIIDHEAKQFRKNIIELLMSNHPHDCPVCEEGGHCHLQDMTVMTGHNLRHYRFKKRTHQNQYIGPFIKHEMNRCIACYRCVRYYKDYTDGDDLGVYGIHDNIYFGRFKDGNLESEFSGNLVDICPTGVFTDKIHSKYYSRKWDMQFAPSICQQCCVGCNISPGERYGRINLIENRYHGEINRYFLCDLGRFGYGYVNHANRPKKPLLRCDDNKWIILNKEQAIQHAVDALHQADNIIGIGSPRTSIENNYALYDLVGAKNFYAGIGNNEHDQALLILNILNNGGVYTPSLHEIESYDTILILGEDVTQTSARIALAIRQAVKGKAKDIAAKQKIFNWQSAAIINIGQYHKYPLFITNVDSTKLDNVAKWSYYASVNDQARLGFAIASFLDNTAPKVDNLDYNIENKAKLIAETLAQSNKPLIISGSHSGSKALISAAANIAFALKKNYSRNVGISLISAATNSIGLSMIGGNDLDHALDTLQSNSINCVIVLENDLYRHASTAKIDYALKNIDYLIVLDHQYNEIQKKANLVLSAANFVESNGTVINYEGRAQRFFKVYDPAYYDANVVISESWRWLHAIQAEYLSRKINWTTFDHIVDAVAQSFPQLSAIKQISPSSSFRIHGQKIAREPHCYSGRTVMNSRDNIHETRIPQDKDTMFNFSMEGNNYSHTSQQHIAFAWYPGWNSSQAWNKLQDKIGKHLKCGDPGIKLLNNNCRKLDWFYCIPSISKLSSHYDWYVAPYWHLFGSEETSQQTEVIKQCMPKPYVVINITVAKNLGINNNSILNFNCADQAFSLPVKYSDNLTTGQIGLPLGLPGIPPILVGLCIKNIRILN